MAHERDPIVREIDCAISPREALRRVGDLPGRVLLESADLDGFSILTADPIEVLRSTGGTTEIVTADGDRLATYRDAFEGLAAQLASIPPRADPLAASEGPDGRRHGGSALPFEGGMMGFLSYESADTLETLPAPPDDDVGMPDTWFGLYDHAVLWDHDTGRCFGVATSVRSEGSEGSEGRLGRMIARCLSSPEREGLSIGTDVRAPAPELVSSLDGEAYRDGVRGIRELIRAGEFFQANLTRRISARCEMSAEDFYDRLVAESAGGYSAFVDTGSGVVASVSPELFLSVRGARVTTRPIKGTAPRGQTASEDEGLARALLASEKDRAENVMIVDLLRNDLAKVCRPGTVQVFRLNELESLPTVHHLVSTIEGELTATVESVDLLRATFPSGSVTGAPKIRAMAALRALEPVRRGVYTGAIGLIDRSGDMDLSVAIRTTVLRNGYAHYGTGGGITLSSDPDSEWEETEVKAAAFRRALGLGQAGR